MGRPEEEAVPFIKAGARWSLLAAGASAEVKKAVPAGPLICRISP
jgi:hypothetical protein